MLRRFFHDPQGTPVSSIQDHTDEAPWRARLRGFVESLSFQRFIIGVIVVNAIGLGLETIPSVEGAVGGFLTVIDHAALAIFVLEIAAKLLVHRLAYFRDPWNVFDITIVGIALLPVSGGLSVMRALRILRALRIISVVPAMRRQGGGLIVHIASVAARKPDMSGVSYQATKAGVAALAHATMEEERQNGIRVTALLPGLTDTPLVLQRPTPPDPAMLARALKPEDIAETCLFLLRLPARAHVAELVLVPSR